MFFRVPNHHYRGRGSRLNWKQNVKNTSRTPSFHLLTLLLALSPILLLGQKRDDILSIQRDVAQLQDQIKQLQSSQEQKMAALETLLKQTLEESGRVSA